ncbi:MAG: ROK family protein, partial [Luteolibacter sp.]
MRGAGNSSDSRRDRKRRGKISSRALGRTHNRLRGSVLRCGRIAAPAEDVRLGAAGASLGRVLGDPVASAILSSSGHLIGQVVATLANALNPDLIVLSGSLVQTNDILLAAVREAVYGA